MKEKSIFLEFMGDSPIMRVMDYLMEVNGLDFSITDLARNAKVGRATLYRIWDNLIKNEMIVHTRVIGKAKLFKLNMKNPKIKKLAEIEHMLIMEELKKRASKVKLKVEA